MNQQFWKGKRVLITGHTGFKGSWMSLWLQEKGAEVIGYSLNPLTPESLYEQAEISNGIVSVMGDIRESDKISNVITQYKPEIIFHLAAQPLVRRSYLFPVETYEINVIGTINLLEAARQSSSVKALLNVTSDKCYENTGKTQEAFHEESRLGGIDPYSCSKACSELITNSYWLSYFQSEPSLPLLATARAGNVIGGGDWAEDRLLPDIIRSYLSDKSLLVRYPLAVRPWQHVLEPIAGYLRLAEKLYEGDHDFVGGWNFGPSDINYHDVIGVIKMAENHFSKNLKIEYEKSPNLKESHVLKLDSSKAWERLGWKSKLSVEEAVHWSSYWYQCYMEEKNMRKITIEQITKYEGL